jgi:hypothetical protein
MNLLTEERKSRHPDGTRKGNRGANTFSLMTEIFHPDGMLDPKAGSFQRGKRHQPPIPAC